MIDLREMGLTFRFVVGWRATKYDDWSFYRNRFSTHCMGPKAVDFLAIDPGHTTLWLIEVKDYRAHRRVKEVEMWNEMALKVKDTLAGLVAAKMDSTHDQYEFAAACLNVKRIRVVLHLEQPVKPSKLFPRAYNPIDVEIKLGQLLKPIDAHPLVAEMANLRGLAWHVSSVGA